MKPTYNHAYAENRDFSKWQKMVVLTHDQAHHKKFKPSNSTRCFF